MNLGDLKAFVAVAEAGSVNRAAAKLNLTQPAVTRRVQSLEAAFGVPLLDRSCKPPALTEDGRQALTSGRKILAAIEDLSLQVGSKRGLGGEFRLGIAPGFIEAAFGEPLDMLTRTFPNISLRISSGWSRELLDALRAETIDAALAFITEPHTTDGSLVLRAFAQDTVVVVASRRTAIAAAPSIVELGKHPWVLNPRGCGFRAALQRAIDRDSGHLNLCAEIQGYDLQMSLIARGVGLGLIPRARFKSALHGKQLKIIEPRDFQLLVTPALVTLARQHRLQPAVDLLATAIKATHHHVTRT